MTAHANSQIERWIQSCKRECLGHFIIFGQRHLDHLCSEFLAHYHEERPHQGLGNMPLTMPRDDPPYDGAIQCRQRLGGLLRHYYRKAA